MTITNAGGSVGRVSALPAASVGDSISMDSMQRDQKLRSGGVLGLSSLVSVLK